MISITRKINHWLLFVAFLGLCVTALAADFFFSKEALMNSFDFSLSDLNITIYPMDQLYIARIARRVTWDWHFYIGLIFMLSNIYIIVSDKRRLFNKYTSLMYVVAFVLILTGIMLYARLYIKISPETFELLKVVHNYTKWIYIATVVVHVWHVVKKENEGSNKISSMFKGSSKNV